MIKLNSLFVSLVISWFVFLPTSSFGSKDFKRFNTSEYPEKDFKLSSFSKKIGSLKIDSNQVKRITKDHSNAPHFCRAWLQAFGNTDLGPVISQFFDDFEPVGFSYGIFVPKNQVPKPYFAVIKSGDYDGHMFLFHEKGKLFDLPGGFYFISKDKKLLFSQYASDAAGLAVFDFKAGETLFSSKNTPYQHEWYFLDGEYFFTESEWVKGSGTPIENTKHAYFFSVKNKNLEKRKLTEKMLKRSVKVEFGFDPRKEQDCEFVSN